jgi:dTDP-4-dehydrorhamnose reductase
MKVTIFGAGGRLGKAMADQFADEKPALYTRGMVSVADAAGVSNAVDESQPDVIINCAGYTDVDGCERDYVTPVLVNSTGPLILAEEAKRIGATLVHISTDFVFGGDGPCVYGFREDDTPSPVNWYGMTKLQGERNVERLRGDYLILRTAWLYGPPEVEKGFPASLIRTMEHESIDVVSDRIGSPSYTVDVAMAVQSLLLHKARGIVHYVNAGGPVSRYEVMVEFAHQMKFDAAHVRRIAGSQWSLDVAPRPKNTHLDTGLYTHMTHERPRTWTDAVEDYVYRWKAQRAA